MTKALSYLVAIQFAFLIILGCGGPSGQTAEQLPENIPVCTDATVCTCKSPLNPCYAEQLDEVLACYEGFMVEIGAINTFTNPKCHPDTEKDAGSDAKECTTDDDCAVQNSVCLVFRCLTENCFAFERDDDEDGSSLCGGGKPGSYDCDDDKPAVHPGATEYCDGMDNDCDEQTDEGCGLPDAGNDTGTDSGVDAEAQAAPMLNVALSSAYPAGKSLCGGAEETVFEFDLKNLSDEEITAKKIRLHRTGVGSASDIESGGLLGGLPLSGKPDATGYVTFDNLNLKIPAKSFKTIGYRVKISATEAQAGSQIAMEIASNADIELANDALVQGFFPIKGNTFTVASVDCGKLSATLDAASVSGTVVKKTQNAEVLSVGFTAGINDVKLTKLRVMCQASIHGAPYVAADCWKRVTSLALFDGDNQVGVAQSPDMQGITVFTPAWIVPNGMTKRLKLKASFAPSASINEPWDKVAFGIASGSTAEDMVYGQAVAVDIADTLANQLTQSPSVTTTVLNSGTLSIMEDGHPPSQIVVAGKDVWVPFASYKATAQYEDAIIDRLATFLCTAELNGCKADNADFITVAVASNGTVKGQGTPPASQPAPAGKWWMDVDMTGNPITVPKDGSVNLQIWTKLAPVMSHAQSSAAYGVARSGHAPALGLVSGITDGEWDAKYASKLNIRTTGQVSGERLYAGSGAARGNQMVLRKTKLIVTPQSLANTMLLNGEIGLYRFQLFADQTGCAGFKQVAFKLSKSADVSLMNFRLVRGASMVLPEEYHVVDIKNGTDLFAGATEDATYALVNMSFVNEDVICGSGNIYELRATAAFTGNGKFITTGLLQEYPVVITGVPTPNLINMAPETPSPWFFHVLEGQNTDGPFIWSDQSELPHSIASADWTNGYLVEDLSVTSTLSN